MSRSLPFSPNTNPEPRVKPKIGNITPAKGAASPEQSRGGHIANSYQNAKDTVLNLGFFEHPKGK